MSKKKLESLTPKQEVDYWQKKINRGEKYLWSLFMANFGLLFVFRAYPEFTRQLTQSPLILVVVINMVALLGAGYLGAKRVRAYHLAEYEMLDQPIRKPIPDEPPAAILVRELREKLAEPIHNGEDEVFDARFTEEGKLIQNSEGKLR